MLGKNSKIRNTGLSLKHNVRPFSLWFTIHIFSSRLNFADLGAPGLRALCSDMGSRRSHERRRKTVNEISQSASRLKIRERKRPDFLTALYEPQRLLSLGLASASKLPFGEAVKVPKQSFHFTLQFLCVLRLNIDSLLEVHIILFKV